MFRNDYISHIMSGAFVIIDHLGLRMDYISQYRVRCICGLQHNTTLEKLT